jgi:hypothetical protein
MAATDPIRDDEPKRVMMPLTRNPAHRSPAVLGVLVTLLGLPMTAGAQQAPAAAGTWRIEPTVGVWHQGDRGQRTPREVGPAFALTLSRQRGPGVRVTATAGYHRLDDAYEYQAFGLNGETRTYTYDREIVSLTAGTAADLSQGAAGAVSLGIELGAGWSGSRLDRVVGPSVAPALEPSTDRRRNWEPLFLTVPSLALRRAVAPRLELTGTARILLAVGDMQPQSVPALTMGTAYRF